MLSIHLICLISVTKVWVLGGIVFKYLIFKTTFEGRLQVVFVFLQKFEKTAIFSVQFSQWHQQ